MTDIFKRTADFNSMVCGVGRPGDPVMLDGERRGWFITAAKEELEELAQATTVVDQVDALLDLIYFAAGRLHEMGLTPSVSAACFETIHHANMHKQRGSLAKRPGSKGYDAIKPPGWCPPDLEPHLTPRRMVGPDRGQLEAERNPKVLVIGHARHGKDTVSEMLRDRYDLRFVSSSLFCAEHVVFPALKDKYGYGDPVSCFDDRHEHRAEWYDLIRDFNRPDATRLGRAIFAEHDVYCGLRSKAELNALHNAGAYDVCVWVDASDRLPPEDASSCTVEPWMADYVLDNNGSLEDLELNLSQLMRTILK